MKLTPRAYQLAIYNSAMQNGNTLVVLPTGLGKTLIALMLIKDKMAEGRVLFLTPTKPLAKQHLSSVQEILGVGDEAVLVTGETTPVKRKDEYSRRIIISTPQTIRNDMEAGRLSPEFSLCIFDECHRAVGDYAYTQIAATLKGALHVGLTASPGGKRQRIKEVLDNLGITNIEIRTHLDADVQPYVQKSDIKTIPVDLSPRLRYIKKQLDELARKYARKLGAMGFPPPMKSKGMFMKLGERLRNLRHNIKYPAMVVYYALMHVNHMSELLETQGIFSLKSYLAKLSEKKSKSASSLLKEPGLEKIRELCESDEEHPKLAKLLGLLKKMKGKKVIVFAQYRDQIKKIEHELLAKDIPAKQFVGKKDGVTRKVQEATIAAFRKGEFDVLVCSSIGEEGLDIPSVDAVIFFEPIPSEIRSIQRRGRAARFKKGEIYILMTKGTRDEYYSHASYRKEQKMKEILDSMKASLEVKQAMKKGGKTAAKKKRAELKKRAKKKTLMGQTKMGDFF